MVIHEFYRYLKKIDTSENYQKGMLKVIIRFAEYLGPDTPSEQIQTKEQVLQFLDLKRKDDSEDQDKKWITTWNDYLCRLKYFYRWLYKAWGKDDPSTCES